MSSSTEEADLLGGEPVHVVGAGLAVPQDMTWAGLVAIGRADVVFTTLDPQAWSRIPIDCSKVRVVHLLEDYSPDVPRPENYARAVGKIMEVAETGVRVCYVTHGHPLVFDSVTTGLLSSAQVNGTQIVVQSGVSFIDRLLVDLSMDLSRGLQVHDATELAARDCSIDPQVPLIIAQPAVFGHEYIPDDKSVHSSLKALGTYLARIYPPDHLTHLVTSNFQNGGTPSICAVQVSELHSISTRRAAGGSLVVASVRACAKDGDGA